MTDPEMPPPSRPDARGSARAWGDIVLPLGLIAGVVVLLAIDPGAPAAEPMQDGPEGLEGVLRSVVHLLAAGTEIAAAAVIAWGVVQAFFSYALKVVRPGGDAVNSTEGLRVRLGRTLALGLELTLASDILQTAVAPGRAEVILLGIVILLRTLLNIFLEREIDAIEARQARDASRASDPAAVPVDEGA